MIYLISTLLVLLASIGASLGFIHIFQLNSYRHTRYLRWAKEHKKRFIPYVLVIIIAIVFSLFNNIIGYPVLVICAVAIALSSIFKKAKKPLVYTKRVIRLLITITILHLIIFAVSFASDFGILISGLSFSLVPFIILLADVLNMPIEKSINRYYINDAKKILKSAKGKLRVIGITGSYGKTSVKFYLTSLLSAEYNVLCTPESFNTPLGVVRTIRSSLSAMHDIFVCEMGAKNVGDIKEICDIVSPDHGIITSIGPQHLETFKTLDNVKKTKFELSESVSGGLMFLNGDDENIMSENKGKTAVTYGFGKHNDYRAEIISVSNKGTEFKVITRDGEECIYSTELIGSHNVLNILGAVACSHSLGIPLIKLKPQIRKLKGVPHRLELINRGNITIIDDAYNSNPSGAKAALDTLSLFSDMKILVTPGMVELGEKQDECNYEFGKQASKVCDFIALVGKKQTESILKGLKDAGYPDEKIFVADNLNEAINKVYSLSPDAKKVILLENDLPDNFL